MILNSIFFFLDYGSFKFIPILLDNRFSKLEHIFPKQLKNLHSHVIVAPSFSENIALLVDLTSQICTKIAKSFLEFFLEGIQSIVNVFHGIDSLLLVLLNFSKDDQLLVIVIFLEQKS